MYMKLFKNYDMEIILKQDIKAVTLRKRLVNSILKLRSYIY